MFESNVGDGWLQRIQMDSGMVDLRIVSSWAESVIFDESSSFKVGDLVVEVEDGSLILCRGIRNNLIRRKASQRKAKVVVQVQP